METKITTLEKGYIFNQETKRLESYELISIRFRFTETDKTYKCLVAGVEKEIVTPFLKVYETKEDFERERYSKPRNVRFVTGIDGYIFCKEDLNGDYYSWEYVNGEAVYQKINDLEFAYECSLYGIFDKTRKLYASKEDLYRHHNYTIIEADGTQREVVCLAKKLELTKEQKQLVDEYKYLMEKMNNANLVSISDYDCGYTYFVNKENIEKIDWFDECEGSVSIIDVVEKTKSGQIVHNVCDYGIKAIIKD